MSLLKKTGLGATATSTLSQSQADWMAICIIGAIDLFSARSSVGGPRITGEDGWLSTELTSFIADLKNVQSTCSSNIQTVVNTFTGYTSNYSTYRTNWQNFLMDSAAINGGSFGAWLKSQDPAKIVWSVDSPPAQFQMNLSFYTVLFYMDLQTSYIGVCGNLDAYWSANVPRHSAQVLQSHYFIQAGGAAWTALSGAALQAYQLSLNCLADLAASTILSYGPYGQGYNEPNAGFVWAMGSYAANISNPPNWALPDLFTKHAADFTTYAKQPAVMTFAGNPNSNLPCTIKCGLHGMGNYFDGAASIARQLIALAPLISTVFASTNYATDYANVAPYYVATKPIPNPAPGGDSLGSIFSESAVTGIDASSPYAGFWVSQWANPASPGAPNLNACLQGILNPSVFTFYIVDQFMQLKDNPSKEFTKVYSNSPLCTYVPETAWGTPATFTPNPATTAPKPFTIKTGLVTTVPLGSSPQVTESDANCIAGSSMGSADVATGLSILKTGKPS